MSGLREQANGAISRATLLGFPLVQKACRFGKGRIVNAHKVPFVRRTEGCLPPTRGFCPFGKFRARSRMAIAVPSRQPKHIRRDPPFNPAFFPRHSARVTIDRAPEAPMGCPNAQAPPFTFTMVIGTAPLVHESQGDDGKRPSSLPQMTSIFLQPNRSAVFFCAAEPVPS